MLGYMALYSVTTLASFILFAVSAPDQRQDFYGAVTLSLFFFALVVMKAFTVQMHKPDVSDSNEDKVTFSSQILQYTVLGIVKLGAGISIILNSSFSPILGIFWGAVMAMMLLSALRNFCHVSFSLMDHIKHVKKVKTELKAAQELEDEVQDELSQVAWLYYREEIVRKKKLVEDQQTEENLLTDLGEFLANSEPSSDASNEGR